MRRLLRPLLSFVVLAALVIALLQGAGRVAFALLSHLEVAANQMLAGRQIRIAGLSGGWRGFNPVVRLERLDLPAGHLDDLYVELDLLKTLFESQPVLFRARVGGAALLFEKQDGAGWRLAGMPAGDGFDPMPYLTGTDQLQFDGVLAFARGDLPETELEVAYVASNRSHRSRHRLKVRNVAGDCATPCELRVELERDSGDWALGAPTVVVTASATRFLIGEALLGAASVQLDAVEVDWQESEAASGGRAMLLASGVVARDGRTFGVRLDAVARGGDGHRRGQVTRLELEHGSERLELPVLSLEERDGVLHAALPNLPVGRLMRLLQSALASNEVASRWLGALAVDAQVGDVRAFYRFETGDLGYGLELSEFDMNGYRGVPTIRNGAGSVIGHTRLLTGRPQAEVGNLLEIDMNATDMQVAFPDQLQDEWRVPFARGRLRAFFRRDELGFVAERMTTRIGDSAVSGAVGISRIGKEDERDRRIVALARIDRITLAEARRFVPYTLQPRLYEWLTTTPMDGVMREARIAYQGQFRVPPGEPGRRLEIAGQIENGSVRVHPDWPAVQGFAGPLEVAGREVRAVAEAASSLGADLAGTRLRLRDNGAVADLALAASADAAAVFALVRQSPMQRWLSFVAPDWSASGPLRATGTLSIPLKEAATRQAVTTDPPADLAIDLAIDLDGVGLDLPGYRLQFSDLVGPLRYRYPDDLQSAGISGSMFDAPVAITANSADQRFGIELAGTARSVDLWHVIDVRDPRLVEGAAKFSARLDLSAPARAGDRRVAAAPPRLSIRSNLEGMALRLPGHYAKPPEQSEPFEADLVFPADRRELSFRYVDATGWLAFGERLEQGSVGLGVEPLRIEPDAGEVVFTGNLDRVVLDDLPLEGGVPGAPPLPMRLRDVEIEELVFGGFATDDARLEADLQPDGFDLRLESERLTGTARRPFDSQAPAVPAGEGRVEGQGEAQAAAGAEARDERGVVPVQLVIEDLRLPAGSGDRDPLSVDIIPRIPAMDVDIGRLTVGEADYGSWRFRLRQEDGDLWFHDLEGQLRKVGVIATNGLVWRGATDETTFEGRLKMGNLAEVLPLWGYAPSVESESVELKGAMTWSGSPASFELLALRGEASVRAKTGRFVDVQTGGGTQRILSLLNFTTIAKRISLDFSDVFGKGLSFDKLKATFSLNQGILEFLKPLDVEGTGLKFRLNGTVGMQDRTLDQEMIVTLPVSRGLPWYAAYVGLANPIAGLGVLVGERMLRKPLEQFSSAKYRITGTVDVPKVELVSVFDTTASERPVEVPVKPGPLGPVEAPVDDGDPGTTEGSTEQ